MRTLATVIAYVPCQLSEGGAKTNFVLGRTPTLGTPLPFVVLTIQNITQGTSRIYIGLLVSQGSLFKILYA